MSKFRTLLSKLDSLSLQDLEEGLERLGFVKDISIYSDEDKVRIVISGCKYARKIHPYISKNFLCPWAALVIMLLKMQYGDIHFAGKLPRITDTGSITELNIR